jgi:hypothetical protein
MYGLTYYGKIFNQIVEINKYFVNKDYLVLFSGELIG